MEPVAFRYYVSAFIRYIESEYSTGDSAAVNYFARLLKQRLDKLSIVAVTPILPALSLGNGWSGRGSHGHSG